jgi:SAM-dependent methyltransferase
MRWLDMGCGTGALSDAIVAEADPDSVLAVDSSEGFIAFFRARANDPRITYQVGNAMDNLATPGFVDIAVSGLMVNFVPEPVSALRAMRHAVVPGGILAFYVWNYPGRMDMTSYFWEAATALWPEARANDQAVRFSMCRGDILAGMVAQAGGRDVQVVELEASRNYFGFEDFWAPLTGGQGPAPGFVSQLSEDDRQALRQELRNRLPIRPDGSFELIARAWALRALC